MDWSFDWAQIISNEIAHQLSNYQQTNEFFMTTCLVYVVVYNFILKELTVKRDIDISQEPKQFWYLMLWKLKAPFHIYQIHDLFMERCRAIFTREVSDRVTQEAKDFLEEKVYCFLKKKTHILEIMVLKEHLSYSLSLYVIDFLSQSCVANTYTSPCSLNISVKKNSYKFHFQL